MHCPNNSELNSPTPSMIPKHPVTEVVLNLRYGICTFGGVSSTRGMPGWIVRSDFCNCSVNRHDSVAVAVLTWPLYSQNAGIRQCMDVKAKANFTELFESFCRKTVAWHCAKHKVRNFCASEEAWCSLNNLSPGSNSTWRQTSMELAGTGRKRGPNGVGWMGAPAWEGQCSRGFDCKS